MTTSSRIDFNGQVGLVTGAGGGLGSAYARLLAGLGATVVMQDVGAGLDGSGSTPLRIENAVAALRVQGMTVEASADPIDERSQCQHLVQSILDRHGRLDFIINNAGWVHYQPIEVIDEDSFERMLRIGVKAPLWLAQAAWPAMRAAGGGRIVFTSSDRALYPQYVQAGLSGYAAAKMAVLGVANVLAREGVADGILVNSVSPVAKTRLWGIDGEPDELHPDAVAAGVAFLVSRQCLDGGWMLRASNGQFHAVRLHEAEGVAYPRDLRAVLAATVDEVAQRWGQIARITVEPRA